MVNLLFPGDLCAGKGQQILLCLWLTWDSCTTTALSLFVECFDIVCVCPSPVEGRNQSHQISKCLCLTITLRYIMLSLLSSLLYLPLWTVLVLRSSCCMNELNLCMLQLYTQPTHDIVCDHWITTGGVSASYNREGKSSLKNLMIITMVINQQKIVKGRWELHWFEQL